MKQKLNDINEVWKAIDQGKKVFWVSDAHQLTVEDSAIEWRERLGYEIPFSNRDGKCLRVTRMSNWFGSLLLSNEINSLYVKNEEL